MTKWEQVKANVVDSMDTTVLGGLMTLIALACQTGLVNQIFSAQVSALICAASGGPAGLVAGPALMVSRSPLTPPR